MWISRLVCSECSWRRSGALAGTACAPWRSWKTPSASLRSPALESLTVYSITSWRECAGKQALHLIQSVHTVTNCILCNFSIMPVFQVMQILCYKILWHLHAAQSSAGVNFWDFLCLDPAGLHSTETACLQNDEVHPTAGQLHIRPTERLSWWPYEPVLYAHLLLLLKATSLSITACMRRCFYTFLYRILKCFIQM